MIIGKKRFCRHSCEELKGTDRVEMLISDDEMRRFVEGLRVGEVHAVATRLLIVAIAAVELMQDRTEGRFDDANLRLIRRLSSEGRNRRYRRLMRRVVTALDRGREGFNSVYLTAAKALSMIYQSLPEYETARQLYEADVKQIRRMSGAIKDRSIRVTQD